MPEAPSIADLNEARDWFEKNEPRGLFYRAATELVSLALEGRTSLSLCEALAVLLQTWNRAYYRFRGGFKETDFQAIDSLLKRHEKTLIDFRTGSIESMSDDYQPALTELFADFEVALGPVGAAKALHLLAPDSFPLWDRAIARAYRLPLRPAGTNAKTYWEFMEIARTHCISFGGRKSLGRNALKAWDEYNYVRQYPWMRQP